MPESTALQRPSTAPKQGRGVMTLDQWRKAEKRGELVQLIASSPDVRSPEGLSETEWARHMKIVQSVVYQRAVPRMLVCERGSGRRRKSA